MTASDVLADWAGRGRKGGIIDEMPGSGAGAAGTGAKDGGHSGDGMEPVSR